MVRPNIDLLITFVGDTGEVQVKGPISDQMFCLGLLEMAKIALNNMAQQPHSPMVVIGRGINKGEKPWRPSLP